MMPDIKVKPLNWRTQGEDRCTARSCVLGYMSIEGPRWSPLVYGPWHVRRDGVLFRKNLETEAEAKGAVQAAHDETILNCIEATSQ